MDTKHQEMLEFVASCQFGDIVCPEYLQGAIAATKAPRNVVPYCAASRMAFGVNDGVVIHKGLMYRLPFPALAVAATQMDPVFANEVFVVYMMRAQASAPARPEIMRHVTPVEHFCRSWGLPHTKAPRKKAALVSAWGVGNVGDEAVTLAAEHICREIGVEEVVHLGPSGNYDEIRDCDLVVVGGGGLIYDNDMENVSNYTAPVTLAKSLGIPAVVLGVGTQGVNTSVGKQAYEQAYSDADLVTVRSELDAAIMRNECGVANCLTTSDLAFALPRSLMGEAGERLDGAGGRRLAIISLSKLLDSTTGKPGYARTLCIGAAKYLQTHGYSVIFAQHSIDDQELYSDVTAELNCKRILLVDYGVRAAIELYRSADLVVTSRFHGVVFASLVGTPVAIWCSRGGKTGRLIANEIPSLQDGARFVSAADSSSDVADTIRNAQQASIDEVEGCRTAALSNIELLRNAVVVNGRAGSRLRAQVAIAAASPEGIAASAAAKKAENENIEIETSGGFKVTVQHEASGKKDRITSTWAKDLGLVLDRIVPAKGRNGKGKARFIEIDRKSDLFEVVVRKRFGDAADIVSGSIDELLGSDKDFKPKDVNLVKIPQVTPETFRMIARKFKESGLLVDNWEPTLLDEQDMRNISMEAGLQDFAIATIINGALHELPIYAMSDFAGSVVFLRAG